MRAPDQAVAAVPLVLGHAGDLAPERTALVVELAGVTDLLDDDGRDLRDAVGLGGAAGGAVALVLALAALTNEVAVAAARNGGT